MDEKIEEGKRQKQKIVMLEHDTTLNAIELKMERSLDSTKNLLDNRKTFDAVRKMDALLGLANEKISTLETANKSLLLKLEESKCSVCKMTSANPLEKPGEELEAAHKVMPELDQHFRLLSTTMDIFETSDKGEDITNFADITSDLARSFTLLNDIVLKPKPNVRDTLMIASTETIDSETESMPFSNDQPATPRLPPYNFEADTDILGVVLGSMSKISPSPTLVQGFGEEAANSVANETNSNRLTLSLYRKTIDRKLSSNESLEKSPEQTMFKNFRPKSTKQRSSTIDSPLSAFGDDRAERDSVLLTLGNTDHTSAEEEES
jgi:hypothetical protein